MHAHRTHFARVRTCEISHVRTYVHISAFFFQKNISGHACTHIAHILHACRCAKCAKFCTFTLLPTFLQFLLNNSSGQACKRADVRNFAHLHFCTHFCNLLQTNSTSHTLKLEPHGLILTYLLVNTKSRNT